MASVPITSWSINGEKWKQWPTLFSWAPKSLWTMTAAMKLKGTCSLKWKLWQTYIEYLKTNKGTYSQSYGFSSSHVWIWELDHEERWVLRNWCFWTVVLEKTLESPLDCKEIKPVNPRGDQSWMFIGRTDAKAEAPIFGHLMWKTDSFEKTLMLGKIEGGWRRGQQRMRLLDGITWLNGHEFE